MAFFCQRLDCFESALGREFPSGLSLRVEDGLSGPRRSLARPP